METFCTDGFVSLSFFFFFWLKTATGRNVNLGQNLPELNGMAGMKPKLSGIGPEVEWVALPIQTASWYEIFLAIPPGMEWI